MYCLRCKKKTQTTNQREEVTKNGRRILLCTYPVLPSSVHVCIYFE